MNNPFGEFGEFLNDLMEEAFEPEIVTLHNDYGEELEAEVVDYVDYEDEEYVILTEPGSDCEKILLLKVVYDEKTGEQTYVNIADDALVNAVMSKYMSEDDEDDDFGFDTYDDDDDSEEEEGVYSYEFPFGDQ